MIMLTMKLFLAIYIYIYRYKMYINLAYIKKTFFLSILLCDIVIFYCVLQLAISMMPPDNSRKQDANITALSLFLFCVRVPVSSFININETSAAKRNSFISKRTKVSQSNSNISNFHWDFNLLFAIVFCVARCN